MLTRIVEMTFSPDRIEEFLEMFDNVAPHIRNAGGCLHLELWQHASEPHLITTHSTWENAEALERYRRSNLFQTTWATTKQMFQERARATSYIIIRKINSAEDARNDTD